MSIIDRSDLKYDYTWSTKPATEPRSDTATDSGTKSNVFRNNEGDQVLSFINDYAKSHGITDKEKALRIEALLRDKLRKEEHEMTRKEVVHWLDNQLEHKK